jgi:hypothetical protein
MKYLLAAVAAFALMTGVALAQARPGRAGMRPRVCFEELAGDHNRSRNRLRPRDRI